MRRQGLATESAAARYFIERGAEEEAAMVRQREAVQRLLRDLRAMDRRYKGPRNLRASEDHDEFLGRLED